jgi:hypothetical protein
MSKRPSLEALAQSAATLQRDNVTTLERDNVATFHQQHVTHAPKRPLRAAPHMSLYVGKRVQRVLKEIALEYDRKPHDIMIEAVDMVLQRYGRPSVAELPDNV